VLDNLAKISFSPAEKTGFITLGMASLLSFIYPALAVIPLFLFLLLCFAAPFFPGFSFFLPIISRGPAGMESIALTFDDGPSPSSTPILLDLLDRHSLQATFFVVGEKAAKYPELITEIIARGHTLGNHSWSHDYFLMLRRQNNLRKDIHKTQENLKELGIQPLVFRPPAGITNPRLGKVLTGEGLITVTYSCRALDRGNRNIRNLSGKILEHLQPGDIVMLHDLAPHQKKQLGYWQKELDHLFRTLTLDYNPVPLEQLIRQPVMRLVN